MARHYWIRQGPNVQGPFDAERVKRYIGQGRVRPDMQLSEDGVIWRVGSEFAELFPPTLALREVGPALEPSPPILELPPPAPRPVPRVAPSRTSEADGDTCPHCGEQVRVGARTCKHCGERITTGRSARRDGGRAPTGVQPGALVALGGGLLVVVGCLAPWVRMLGLVSFSGFDSNEGKLLAATGLFAGVFASLALATRQLGPRWLYLIAGVVVAGDGTKILMDLRSVRPGSGRTLERALMMEMTSVQWGLYVVIVGGVALLVAGLLPARSQPGLAPPRGSPRGRSGASRPSRPRRR